MSAGEARPPAATGRRPRSQYRPEAANVVLRMCPHRARDCAPPGDGPRRGVAAGLGARRPRGRHGGAGAADEIGPAPSPGFRLRPDNSLRGVHGLPGSSAGAPFACSGRQAFWRRGPALGRHRDRRIRLRRRDRPRSRRPGAVNARVVHGHRRRGSWRDGRRGRASSSLIDRCWRLSGRACGRRAVRQEGQRIDVALRIRGDPDAQVHVWLRHLGVATRPDRSDRVPLGDRRPSDDAQRAEMRQRHGVAARRCDRDTRAGARDRSRERHRARGGRDDGGTRLAPEIDTTVLPRVVRMPGVEDVGLQDIA